MTEKYLTNIQCCKNCWDVCCYILQECKKKINEDVPLELEIRFGQFQKNKFKPGIPKSIFNHLEHVFDNGSEWESVDNWHIVNQFHFNGNYRCDTLYINDAIQTTTMVKEKLAKTDLMVHNKYPQDIINCFRISMASEHVVTDLNLDIVQTERVFIKAVKNFYYVPKNHDKAVWKYSFIKRWPNSTTKCSTLTEALQFKNDNEPIYEIELECIDLEYLKSTNHQILCSKLLHKIVQLLITATDDELTAKDFDISVNHDDNYNDY